MFNERELEKVTTSMSLEIDRLNIDNLGRKFIRFNEAIICKDCLEMYE